MAKSAFIRAITKSLPRNPRVGAPGITAPFDPSRGMDGVQHKPRIKPINTRIYSKKITPDDPSQYFGAGFYDAGQ